MKYIILIVVLGQFNVVHGQKNKFSPKHWTVLDSSKGTAVLFQSRSVPTNVESFWTLSPKEIEIINESFWKIKSLKNVITKKPIKDVEKYYFQYVGIVINGKKSIYINAFKVNNEYELDRLFKGWEMEPIRVNDGGYSYWDAVFDLEKLEFSDLRMNGSS